MNKRLSVLLGVFLIAPGLYASEDAQFEREREAKARSAAINADLATIAERDTVTPESEAILARDCNVSLAQAASVPTEIQEHIWSFAIDSKKRYISNHIEQLIPAVIEWTPLLGLVPRLVASHTIFECLARMKTDKITLGTINQRRANFAGEAIVLPAGKFYYLGRSYWQKDRSAQGGGIQDELEPRLAAQRELIPGYNCFSALYYSNGFTLFKVHDAKRAELEKLSSKQLEYIIGLYHTRARNLAERNSAEIHLTPEQVSIHKSLPTSMRVNLQNVYDLAEIKQEKAAAKRRKQCCTRLAYASLLAMLGYEYLW